MLWDIYFLEDIKVAIILLSIGDEYLFYKKRSPNGLLFI